MGVDRIEHSVGNACVREIQMILPGKFRFPPLYLLDTSSNSSISVADRLFQLLQTDRADPGIFFWGGGGGVVGLLTITIGGLPVTLTASGGALVMGLVFGWLRSVRPTFGRISTNAKDSTSAINPISVDL